MRPLPEEREQLIGEAARHTLKMPPEREVEEADFVSREPVGLGEALIPSDELSLDEIKAIGYLLPLPGNSDADLN